MSNVISSFYFNKASDLQTEIWKTKSAIKSKTLDLTTTEQSSIVKISDKITNLQNSVTDIAKAKEVIKAALDGMQQINKSIGLLKLMASQCSDSTMSPQDRMLFNSRFVTSLQSVGKTALASGVDGLNLLNDDYGIDVLINSLNGNSKTLSVSSFNVYKMVTIGELGNLSVDSTESTSLALSGLANAEALISNNRVTLEITLANLNKQEAKINSELNESSEQVTSIETVATKRMQMKIDSLYNKQQTFTALASSLS